ncbi:clavesin-1-like isoform X2 [Cimex lectularius]|nr:clavesin-1-like isoform X2 [Cimex lectularius]XP_014241652.1 clavesin-1-like isoform X2 [Cimex lectularius]XP_024081565.1 clavesin-1-like isoform X2 [Cimex lectularius]
MPDQMLSGELKELAFKDLREDDTVREESLRQIKDWIEKNPDIKYCRTDTPFLLRFLRTKKFSVPLTQAMIERYIAIRQLYPNWFQKLDPQDEKMMGLIDAGYCIPLPERDELGRRVILTNTGAFDPSKYTSEDMVRMHSLVVESLLDEEENQIRGYTQIYDESGLTMAHLSIWSLIDIRNIIKCIQNSLPMRHKSTQLINLPPSAGKIFEFFTALLSDKLKKRLVVHKNLDELKKDISVDILPAEYGGKTPMAEMISKFKKELLTKREALLALDKLEIDLAKSKVTEDFEDLNGISGSFRKLEVD